MVKFDSMEDSHEWWSVVVVQPLLNREDMIVGVHYGGTHHR